MKPRPVEAGPCGNEKERSYLKRHESAQLRMRVPSAFIKERQASTEDFINIRRDLVNRCHAINHFQLTERCIIVGYRRCLCPVGL